MRVKTTEGEIKDVAIKDVTPQNYIVPNGEEHLYHMKIEVVQFSKDTGKRLTTPRIQKFGRKFIEGGGMDELRRQGYTIDVLHDPNEWFAKEKAEADERKREEEENAKRLAEEKAKREAEEKAQEREKLKAELRAEIMAELGAKDDKKKPGRKAKTDVDEDPEI